MRLILIGPPGSGKGTQAKLLKDRLKLAHIGTGDILREAIRQETDLGLKVKPYITSGQLVPDELVNKVVAACFRGPDRPERFVMDGYPRTLPQAVTFDRVLQLQGLELTAVLLFVVADDEIIRRMTGRWSCMNCKSTYHMINKPPRESGICDVCGSQLIQRVDDQEQTVRERLRLYHANTRDLILHYRNEGILHEVAGIGNIEDIYSSVIRTVSQALPPC